MKIKFKEINLFEIIFILSMLILFILFIIELMTDFNGNQLNIFFLKTEDYMADYYNTAKYSVDRNPYFSSISNMEDQQYLPISYIIMHYMSKLADYKNLNPFDAGLSSIGLATSSLFMFYSSAILFLQMYDLKTGPKSLRSIISILMFLSGIFIFSFERGNLILLSVIFTTFYLVNYKSENCYVREISYISLALAASLKGYPAVLGILLLYDMKFKDAIRLIIYGIVFSFLPFFFLSGGISNVIQWFKNLQLNNDIYEYRFFPRFGYKLYLINIENNLRENLNNVLSVMTICISLLSIYFNFFQNIVWKKIGSFVCMLILIPINSAFYVGLYLFPVVVLFLNDRNHSRFEILHLICFIALLNPYQIVINEINYSIYITNLSVSILFILLFEDSTIAYRNHVKNKKLSSINNR